MIWVIGSKGMLGQEIASLLSDYKLFLTDMDVDITNITDLENFADGKEIEWIINCSAYTAVDRAEDDVDKAFLINEKGVENIGKVAQKIGAKVVHISTDYVFSGDENRALVEDDKTGPIGVYGKSKLAGEKALLNQTKKVFILRTAWLYGQYGNNFVYTMLKLMGFKESLLVVSDQIGSPTWTFDLANAIKEIISVDSSAYGIYHFSGGGECSWFEFAQEILRLGKEFSLIEGDCTLNPCDSAQFPTKAKRPAFSLMSKAKIKSEFGLGIGDWKESLNKFLKEQKNIKKRVRIWIKKADEDFDTAKFMLKSGRYNYVPFLCQQAIEKKIKAVIEQSAEPPYTHNILRLCGIIKYPFDKKEEVVLQRLGFLYIHSRYPEFEDFNVTKKEVVEIEQVIEEMLCRLDQKILY